ncbi:MAG: histidine phosphatase family protein [Candidatus Latescibacteria bacterium]|nr:histidine phosphatase family protein [Candidatus Latescibacterota bacterium]
MILYLLRHGESVANITHTFASRKLDLPLTDFGVEQVKQISQPMSKLGLNKIYTSPLIRAQQTAQIIGDACNLKPVVVEQLREIDVGVLDGKCIEEQNRQMIYDNVISKWNNGQNQVGFEQGESLNDVKNRVVDFLKIIDNTDEKILLVGHGLFFMAFIWLFCDNRGPSFHSGRINRCHYSVLEKHSKLFSLVEHDIAPQNSKKGLY